MCDSKDLEELDQYIEYIDQREYYEAGVQEVSDCRTDGKPEQIQLICQNGNVLEGSVIDAEDYEGLVEEYQTIGSEEGGEIAEGYEVLMYNPAQQNTNVEGQFIMEDGSSIEASSVSDGGGIMMLEDGTELQGVDLTEEMIPANVTSDHLREQSIDDELSKNTTEYIEEETLIDEDDDYQSIEYAVEVGNVIIADFDTQDGCETVSDSMKNDTMGIDSMEDNSEQTQLSIERSATGEEDTMDATEEMTMTGDDEEDEYVVERMENADETEVENSKAPVKATNEDTNSIQKNISSMKVKMDMDKKTMFKGPRRYMLFDDLVACIVDLDPDGTPMVEFSMPNTETDDKLPVECGICPDVMPRSKLSKHQKKHLVPGTNRYQCIYCEETYKDSKYLAGHARRHMGIRPYVCELCKLYFSTKQDMRVHNQRRHQEKEHICEMCGKTFAQNTQLKRHREATHEKMRRFKCAHCPKSYYKNFSLQEHVRAVHMGKRRMITCPFCGMQCRDAHKMARHRKQMHLNQSHYECAVCNEEFTDINYFDAHKRSIQCRNNTRRKQEDEAEQRRLELEATGGNVADKRPQILQSGTKQHLTEIEVNEDSNMDEYDDFQAIEDLKDEEYVIEEMETVSDSTPSKMTQKLVHISEGSSTETCRRSTSHQKRNNSSNSDTKKMILRSTTVEERTTKEQKSNSTPSRRRAAAATNRRQKQQTTSQFLLDAGIVGEGMQIIQLNNSEIASEMGILLEDELNDLEVACDEGKSNDDSKQHIIQAVMLDEGGEVQDDVKPNLIMGQFVDYGDQQLVEVMPDELTDGVLGDDGELVYEIMIDNNDM